jgi:hypothetical protein
VTGDFQRRNPKEACGKALMQAVCEKLKDPAGRIRAEDLITTIASITGELCIDADGVFSSRNHPMRPGRPVFNDGVNKVICGDLADLDAMPSESVVGILRDRLCTAGYTKDEFPHLGPDVFAYFAANFGKPELQNKAPVSVPAEHFPRVHSMAVGYETRPIVDRAFEQLGSDPKARVRAAAHALAEALIAAKDVLPHKIALLLALQVVNGTAKRTTMTDAAMEAFKNRPAPGGPDPARRPTGTCQHCKAPFSYRLLHNGMNESSYAYCADCGMTGLLETRDQDRTADGIPPHQAITAGGERFLAACACGGRFVPGASPRCPRCRETLSAVEAASWIEAQSPGTAKGWRWQRNWDGLYAIIIEDRMVTNPWRRESGS